MHFEPVIHLTEKVETKTNEESEEQTFKMRAKLFKFDRDSREWKERGTGDVRLLKHKENMKTRLVMRRDKTHKVCANHFGTLAVFQIHGEITKAHNCAVVPDMKLTANVGSERSWVWNAAADISEGETEAVTLAIRFANSESKLYTTEPFRKFSAVLITCLTFQTPIFLKHLSKPHKKKIKNSSQKKRLQKVKSLLRLRKLKLVG